MESLRIKITGGLLAAGIAAIATPSPAQDVPAAPAAEKCSFLGCLLRDRQERPARADQVAQAATPPAKAGTDAIAPVTPTEAKPGEPSDDKAQKGKAAKRAAKPAATVILAADPADEPRLKALAAARPRHRLRFVAENARDAELAVKPTLEAAAGTLPLFSEQLHVLAGPAIASLADLRDKPVSFGPADGDTVAIARRAFAAAGVSVKETPLDVSNALDGLATGDIAAVVVLAPQPSPRLAKLRAPDLHLLDWPDGATPPGARRELLKAKSYPRLEKGETHVLAVDAVLALTAKGERSAAARGLFASLKERTASLARRGFDRLGGVEPELRQGRAVAKDKRR